MHVRLLALMIISLGVCFGQQPPSPLTIRSIRVRLATTDSQPGTPIGFDVIAKALKTSGVRLAVEDRLDPAQLQSASRVIRDVYGTSGRNVRVEYAVTEMAPRGVEISFDVVELCNCR